jgi:hypothetical protein
MDASVLGRRSPAAVARTAFVTSRLEGSSAFPGRCRFPQKAAEELWRRSAKEGAVWWVGLGS